MRRRICSHLILYEGFAREIWSQLNYLTLIDGECNTVARGLVFRWQNEAVRKKRAVDVNRCSACIWWFRFFRAAVLINTAEHFCVKLCPRRTRKMQRISAQWTDTSGLKKQIFVWTACQVSCGPHCKGPSFSLHAQPEFLVSSWGTSFFWEFSFHNEGEFILWLILTSSFHAALTLINWNPSWDSPGASSIQRQYHLKGPNYESHKCKDKGSRQLISWI